jgi:hypothetical protein
MPAEFKGGHRKGPLAPTGRVARRRLQRSWARRVVILAILSGAILGVAVGLRPAHLEIGGSNLSGSPAIRLTVDLGGDLIAVVPGEGRLWVVDRDPASLLRLDPATGARDATIFLPSSALTSSRPPGVVAGSGGVWLADAGEAVIRRVDASRDRVVDTIALSSGPVSMALSSDSVWAGFPDGRVARVALSTDHLVALIQTAGADAMVSTPDALWVVSTGSDSVTRIDAATGRVDTVIDVRSRPVAIAAASDSIWTANGVGTVSRIDRQSKSVVDSLPISFVPDAITIAGGNVWVANLSSGILVGIAPGPDVQPVGLGLGRKLSWIAGGEDGVVWACTADGTILAIR